MNTALSDQVDMAAFESYQGKTIVVKAGGELFTGPNSALINNLFHQLALFKTNNIHPILVHGCGNYLNGEFKKAGIDRITDIDGNFETTDQTIGLVSRITQAVNKNICEHFNKVSQKSDWPFTAYGVDSFSSCSSILAEPLTGRTGKTISIKNQEIAQKIAVSGIPIIGSLGADKEGNFYNINADDVACALAIGVNAPCLMILSSTAGVLDAQGHTIKKLDQDTAFDMMAKGVISGGMKKKVMQMLNAAAQGIGDVATMHFAEPYSLIKQLVYKSGADTATLVTIKASYGLRV